MTPLEQTEQYVKLRQVIQPVTGHVEQAPAAVTPYSGSHRLQVNSPEHVTQFATEQREQVLLGSMKYPAVLLQVMHKKLEEL